MSRGPYSGSNYLTSTDAQILVTAPFSVVLRYQPNSFAAGGIIWQIGRSSGGEFHRHFLYVGTDGKLEAGSSDTGQSGVASAAAMTLSAFNFCGGVFGSSTQRRLFLNQAAAVENTTSRTPTSPARVRLGLSTEGNSPANGQIAEFAMWNVALTDDEMAAMADDFPPMRIRPQSLISYAPLVRDVVDMRGNTFTVSGTVAVADHPRIYGVS